MVKREELVSRAAELVPVLRERAGLTEKLRQITQWSWTSQPSLLPALGLGKVVHSGHGLHVLSHYVHGAIPSGDLAADD